MSPAKSKLTELNPAARSRATTMAGSKRVRHGSPVSAIRPAADPAIGGLAVEASGREKVNTNSLPAASPPTDREDRVRGPFAEVDQYSQAGHEDGPGPVEAGTLEDRTERIGLEVGRGVPHVRGWHDACPFEALQLVALARAMIDLDDPQIACPGRLPVGERVQPSSEDHVLTDATSNPLRKAVLRILGPHQHVGADGPGGWSPEPI